jgi:catechol 2,3-dioxygenase-like lactoylglutathione lyase family enzyme
VTHVTKTDFVGIPTQDMDRAIAFYKDTLGLRQDEHREAEFWAGETCFSLWKPEWAQMEFAPATTAFMALHVEDVAQARKDLEAKGVEFRGEIVDTGVCHMAFFNDPDGNSLMFHHRYKAYE